MREPTHDGSRTAATAMVGHARRSRKTSAGPARSSLPTRSRASRQSIDTYGPGANAAEAHPWNGEAEGTAPHGSYPDLDDGRGVGRSAAVPVVTEYPVCTIAAPAVR